MRSSSPQRPGNRTQNPEASFTYEIAYNSSGNRNKLVGDSIFHCHFYPHFAQGMWALWRTHDVFEMGTVLDADGKPAPGSRALPDGEIAVGTPIPALVPISILAMAPMPGAHVEIVRDAAGAGQVNVSGNGNPGYPFFIAANFDAAGNRLAPGALAGHRPPTPPYDIAEDGGLPRHVITSDQSPWAEVHNETPLDFNKTLLSVNAMQVPETGTALEQAAMAYHHRRHHDSYRPALSINRSRSGSFGPLRLRLRTCGFNFMAVLRASASVNVSQSASGTCGPFCQQAFRAINLASGAMPTMPFSFILTTLPHGTYNFIMSGSSFAAAHVSGVIALLLELNPQLTGQQVASILHTAMTHPISVKAIETIDACAAVASIHSTKACSDVVKIGHTLIPPSNL